MRITADTNNEVENMDIIGIGYLGFEATDLDAWR